MAERVRAHLAYVTGAMRPFATGATYVNFLDLDRANPERIRAAYSPEDWERLVALKDRYDSENLFRFNRNIPPSSAAETSGEGTLAEEPVPGSYSSFCRYNHSRMFRK